MKSKGELLFILAIAAAMFSALYVFAAPQNEPQTPEAITVISSGRYQDFNNTAAVGVDAEAGNVTELLINDTRSTYSWQGYFGNVTGTITLDDGSNYTLYSWSAASPTGEIYATNHTSTVTWTNMRCLNFTEPADITTGSGQTMNESTLENDFAINITDRDGFSETFTQTYSCGGGGEDACFKVGGWTVPDDECHMVTTYVDEAPQVASFKEIILTDNSTSALIFVTLLEDNVDGFKQGVDQHDFQMLVAENGHPGHETITSTYYFYVELA